MFRVLLVCTGNICRSPIAHGLLADRSKRLLDGAIEVGSAGTWSLDGSPATPEAVLAAADLGIDIAGHRSSRFIADHAIGADLILTMTSEQLEEVLSDVPEVSAKAFTLKEVVALLASLPPIQGLAHRETVLERVREAERVRSSQGGPRPVDLDVADPLGLSLPVYQAVAREIEGLIDRLVRGLAGDRDAAFAKEG